MSATLTENVSVDIVELRHALAAWKVARRPVPAENRHVLLGRRDEVVRLVELLSQGASVAVVGEPGVGKTTLLHAALAELGRPSFVGGGFATLSWLPYLPLARALGVTGFEAGDSAHVAATVAQAVGDGILVLDDIHWADADTLRVLPLVLGRTQLLVGVRTGDPATEDALDVLRELDVALLPVEPLAAGDAARLARQLQPDLPRARVSEIVRQSGGNPLLVEELAAHGEASPSLRLALGARLRRLSPAARESMGILSLAGRPLEPDVVGDVLDELVRAGLAAVRDGRLEVRHALLAATAIDLLEPDERRRLHSKLAAMLSEAGESARHHAAAGEAREAFDKAMAAADAAGAVGERASHLEVAAACFDGPAVAVLRLDAARALAAAGRYEAVDRILEDVVSDDHLVEAEACLLRARGAAERDDIPGTGGLLARAGRLAAGSDTALEHRIAVDRLELDLATLGQEVDGRPRAARLVEIAEARGWNRPFALAAYARAQLAHDERVRDESTSPEWRAAFSRAIAAAVAENEVELECRTREQYGARLVKVGWSQAFDVFEEGRDRASTLRLLAWQRRFETRLLWIDFHAGRSEHVFEGAQALLTQPLDAWERFLLLYLSAQSAGDLGRFDRARSILDELDTISVGNQRQRQALWARADVELAAGRPRAAVDATTRVFTLFPGEMSAFVRVTHAWAQLELGLDPGPPDVAPVEPFLGGVRPELEGVWHTHHGRFDDASAAFERARAAWRGQHVRGELRAAWAAGDAARAAGHTGAAIDALLEVERRAEELAHAPLLARIRRSLRAAGVTRSSARGAGGGALSRREREILDLVGSGLTNVEIGRRLGITRRTVETILASACRKLGADTRAQAAALAAQA